MNITNALFSRPRHSPILGRAAALLAALAWTSVSFGGEIHDAARNGDLEKVRALLAANPKLVFSLDTNTNKDDEGSTPLHLAALNGHLNVAALLLTNGAEVNATNRKGWTPLHSAAYMGWHEVAALLLTNNAEVNARDNSGETPLHVAAETAVMVATDDDCLTPLHMAAVGDNKEAEELLLANQAEVNAKDGNGWTPFHVAVFCGYTASAELLRQHGGHE